MEAVGAGRLEDVELAIQFDEMRVLHSDPVRTDACLPRNDQTFYRTGGLLCTRLRRVATRLLLVLYCLLYFFLKIVPA